MLLLDDAALNTDAMSQPTALQVIRFSAALRLSEGF